MSHVQNNSAKNASKVEAPSQVSNETPNSEAIVLTPQVEELKPQKSVIEIAKSVSNLNGLLKNHMDFQTRLEEISNFKSLMSDGSGCNLVITHSSGVSISFANLEFIQHFVKEAFANGEKAIKELEIKIQNSTL
jgi:hypothetical protein